MDRGAWRATVHVAKHRVQLKLLSMHAVHPAGLGARSARTGERGPDPSPSSATSKPLLRFVPQSPHL